MVSRHLQTSAKDGALTIKINGPLDLMLTSALNGCCQNSGSRYQRFIIDLQNVSIVRDSGLALLLMLQHLTSRTGATLNVINGTKSLKNRCIKLGIKPA
jgi:ABC-type transporter Mla MlaB component